MDLIKVKLKSEFLTKTFVFHLLKSYEFKDYAISCSNGSSVIHLGKSALPTFKFKVKNTEQILQFSTITEPWDMKIISNLKQIQTLENLRDTLLPKLINGEIRLKTP